MIRRLVIAAGCAAAASLVLAGSLAAQTGVISGRIIGQHAKAGLEGAEVRIKGTDLVARTQTDGRFTIAGVPVGTHEIAVARPGYIPLRMPSIRIVSADTTRLFFELVMPDPEPMRREAQEVHEVQTVVSDSSASQIGIRRSRTTTSIGEVSENAPLYIIDGVILSGGSIPAGLDPASIVSIEVIKGATAQSMYGPRAANGVITITTRRPPD
jgi:TonB-dependent SusC/RagA subfamily outer membrane receptor